MFAFHRWYVQLPYNATASTQTNATHRRARVVRPALDLIDVAGTSHTTTSDHLRRDHPVFILSGNQDLGTARRTLRSGAFDYLPKPFTIDVLARVVASAAAMPRRGPRGA